MWGRGKCALQIAREQRPAGLTRALRIPWWGHVWGVQQVMVWARGPVRLRWGCDSPGEAWQAVVRPAACWPSCEANSGRKGRLAMYSVNLRTEQAASVQMGAPEEEPCCGDMTEEKALTNREACSPCGQHLTCGQMHARTQLGLTPSPGALDLGGTARGPGQPMQPAAVPPRGGKGRHSCSGRTTFRRGVNGTMGRRGPAGCHVGPVRGWGRVCAAYRECS